MEQQPETTFENINHAIKNSVSVKLLSIGLLIAILLIPNSMIKSLIRERQSNQQTATHDVWEKWAAPLELTGPIISIPFEKELSGENGPYVVRNYAHFLPEELNINGDIAPETRKRGIYEVIVYSTSLKIAGSFSEFDFSEFTDQPENILWNEATISMGIPDLRGIQSNIKLSLDKSEYNMEPGVPAYLSLDLGQTNTEYGIASPVSIDKQSGVNARIAIDPSKSTIAFNTTLDIRGTKELLFNPVGKSTNIALKSSWKHPSFTGQFLPDDYTIDESGFASEWSVFDLNRNYPQKFMGRTHSIKQSAFGVSLFQPVDNYQQNTRSAKYAVLILFLTFITFFFIEILNKKKIHPIQYILVGLALSIFYTLLLSLSEVIGFTPAYIVAALIIIGMLSVYSASILQSKKLALTMAGFFSLIYTFIYVILQMEDFALLVGSFGLLVVLGICMHLSRKVDWYNIKPTKRIAHESL